VALLGAEMPSLPDEVQAEVRLHFSALNNDGELRSLPDCQQRGSQEDIGDKAVDLAVQ
jgi:hypothetical protein